MRYLIFILSIFLVLSCSDDGSDENNVDTGSSWVSHPSFYGQSKIVLNAVSENNRLTFAGINYISVLNSLEELIITGVASDGTMDYKPVIQNDYVIYKPNNSVGQISINSNYYYKTVDNSQYPFTEIIQLNDLDSVNFNVDDEIFVYSNFMPIAAVNSQDQVLFAVQKDGGQKVCLLDLHIAYYEAFSAECMSVSPEIIATFESTNYSYSFVKAFGENFFVEIDGELKKITPEGELIETGFDDNILNMFEHNGHLYAHGFWTGKVYKSESMLGESWTEVGSLYPSEYSIKYFHVGDILCIFNKTKIYKFDVDSMELVELENTGLEGDYITSVSVFNDKVWLSTLSGVYTKPLEDFFTEKEVEEKGNKLVCTPN